MKKYLAMLVCAALFAGMTGCSNDDNDGPGIDEGKPTKMGLAVLFPQTAGTRADGDENATGDELAIKTVDVFIYDDAGSYIKHEQLVFPTDFAAAAEETANGHLYKATKRIGISTGPKKIYVGVNMIDASEFDGKSASAAATVAQTMSRSDLADISNTGLPMFSTALESATFVELTGDENDPLPDDNVVSVSVKRNVAKLEVVLGSEANTADGAGMSGKIQNVKFIVNNFNTRYFLQQGDAPRFMDPNWTADELGADDLDVIELADGLNGYTAAETGNFLYVPENTSSGKLKGEITRVTVAAEFIPEEVNNASGGKIENENYEDGTAATLYRVDVTAHETSNTEGGSYLFLNEATAGEFINSLSEDLPTGNISQSTYVGGVCFWQMYFNKDKAKVDNEANLFDVLRNDYYKYTIKKFVAPGRFGPELLPGEEDDEPDQETQMTVEVEVQKWNMVEDEYTLEP